MKLLLTFFFLLIKVVPSYATDKGAPLLCRKHIIRIEKKLKIPAGLLEAISIIESGRKTKGRTDLVAWPWVINVAGKPEHYKTKTTAVKAINKHLDAGVMNIDVGCMQINYRHHGAEFRSPTYMMDPRRNIEYAAKFLIELRKRYGSWTKAVGHYHSATLKHQVPYRHKVYRKWRNVRHVKKQKSTQKRSLSLLQANAKSAKRLLRPLNKNPTTRETGNEVIRPKKTMVQIKDTQKPKKPFNGLIHPNNRLPKKNSLHVALTGRHPHFFKK